MEELKKCPFCGSENVRLMCFDGAIQEEICIDSEEELDEQSNYPYIATVAILTFVPIPHQLREKQ